VILEKKISHYQYRITSAERQRQRSQFEERSKQRMNEFELRNKQFKVTSVECAAVLVAIGKHILQTRSEKAIT
jgi:hypothetical protein